MMELNVKVKTSICKGVLDVYTYTIDKGDVDVIPYYLMPDGSYKTADEIGLVYRGISEGMRNTKYYYVVNMYYNEKNVDIRGKRTIALVGGSEVLIAEAPFKIYTGNYYLYHEAKFIYEPRLTYNGCNINLAHFVIEDSYIGELATIGHNKKYYNDNGLTAHVELYSICPTIVVKKVDVPATVNVSGTTITITLDYHFSAYCVDRILIVVYGNKTLKDRHFIDLLLSRSIDITGPIKLKFTYTFRC
jgi:hypothetical protein